MLEILPYDKENLDKSYEFLMETFQVSFGPDKSTWPNGLGTYHLEKYRADIEGLLSKPDKNWFYSAHHDGQVVGQIELKRLKDGTGYVSFYYLIAEYRNKGWGRQLDEFALQELKNKGFQKIRLTVSELNKNAQRFYEKQGWKSLGPDPVRPMGITMEKLI